MTRVENITDGRFAVLLDDDGALPHGDECEDVCRLFGRQRAGESRRGWLARIGAVGAGAERD